MSYPPICEGCKNYQMDLKGGYKICTIFNADVLSLAGNGVNFDECIRYIK